MAHEALSHEHFDVAGAQAHGDVDGMSPISRKARIVMRDPQQARTVTSYELPAFEFAGPNAAAEEAGRVVAEARANAETMIAQTRAACEADLESARQRGYAQGYEEGLNGADEEMASLIATAEQIAVNAAEERARLIQQAEGDVVELAIAIAQRLVNAAIEVDHDLVVEVCRGAMRRAFQRETLTVQAHPADLHALREAGPQLANELGGVQHLEFVEERRLQRGSVIVRTPAGEIDATFEGKAAVIAQELRELVLDRAGEWRAQRAA
jgi:flagellar assembly protein FliH